MEQRSSEISLESHVVELVEEKVREEVNRRLKELKQATIQEAPSLSYAYDSFSTWMRQLTHRTGAFYGASLAIPGLTTIAGIIAKYSLSDDLKKQLNVTLPNLDMLVAGMLFLQFVVVFCLIWLIPKPPNVGQAEELVSSLKDANEELGSGRDYDRAFAVTAKFARMWEFAWIFWAMFYLVWAMVSLIPILLDEQATREFSDASSWAFLTNFMNNLVTMFLFMCYRELAFKTEKQNNDQVRIIFSILTFLGFVAILQLVAASNVNLAPFAAFFKWLGSLAAGATLALLVGRLESKFINPPLYLMVCLYFYAAIQLAFVFFPEDKQLTLVMTGVAFFCKVLLFMFIAWLLGSGVLTFYLAEVNSLHDKTPGRRRAFVNLARMKLKKHDEREI